MDDDTHLPFGDEESFPGEPVAAPPGEPGRPRLCRIDVILMIAIAIVSGIVHFARLATPDRVLDAKEDQCVKFARLDAPCHEMIPLDEWHYVPDARDVIVYGTESDRRVSPDSGAFVVHPPVGKWFIALGIRLFGDAGFGWRAFGAFFGSLASVIMYLLARALWRSRLLAGAAAALLAIEGLWFVMSRIAMLDIYMSFFVLLGVWLLVEDHQRTAADHRGPRWWRLAAGVALGLALASKWGAIPFFAVAFAIAFTWELLAAFRAQSPEARIAPRMMTLAGSLVLLPLVVYTATFTPWFVDDHRYDPPRCENMDASWFSESGIQRALTGWLNKTGRYGKWICYQREMYDFHKGLEKYEKASDETGGPPSPEETPSATQTATGGSPSREETTSATLPPTVTRKPAHPYFGNAVAWPWIGRPVAHYYETRGEGKTERIEHILGLPNPAIWWVAFFVAFPLLVIWVVRRSDRIAMLLLAFIGAGWIPYLLADAVDRPVFLFYALPMVPFLVLAVVHVFARALERFPGASVILAAYLGIAVIAFAYFYPILSAYPLARNGFFGWGRHMWLNAPHVRVFGRYLIPGDCRAVDVIKNFCWI